MFIVTKQNYCHELCPLDAARFARRACKKAGIVNINKKENDANALVGPHLFASYQQLLECSNWPRAVLIRFGVDMEYRLMQRLQEHLLPSQIRHHHSASVQNQLKIDLHPQLCLQHRP